MKQKTFRTHCSFLLLLGSIFYSANLTAQVTIGSVNPPNENALLDLKQDETQPSTKGLLLPRVELKTLSDSYPLTAHTRGMFVFNIANVDAEIYSGCYYNTGTKWERTGSTSTTPSPANDDATWFYFPVTPIDVSTAAVKTIDLYDIYKSQLAKPLGLTYSQEQIEFILLGYDTKAFSVVAISETTLAYKAIPSKVTDATFLNIAIKIKKK